MTLEKLGVPVGIGVVLDGLVWGGDFLLASGDVLLMLGTELYTPLVVTSRWIAPRYDWLDEGLVTTLAVIAATLYVTNVLLNIYERRTTETGE